MTQPTAQRFYANLAHLIRPYRWDFFIGLLAAAASGPAPSPRATSPNDTPAISASIAPSLAPRR